MHRRVALLVAQELRRQQAARRRRAGGHRGALGRNTTDETQERSRRSHARRPASLGATTGEPRGRVRNIHSGPPLLGIRRELLEARDSAALGRHHPAPPSIRPRTRREYRRSDNINPWRHAQFGDDRASTRTGYEGSSRDNHRAGDTHATPREAPAQTGMISAAGAERGGGFTRISNAGILAGHTC
ncbi:hypothetical protein D1007_25337 [Hordeum vulgare]|nr:hypothetical protein D1007_25337 [Hordeum vulgare]